MKKTAHNNAIQFLLSQGKIKATPDGLAPFMPHLNKNEIAALINKANKSGKIATIALPGLLVQNTVLLGSLSPRQTGKNSRPATLSYAGAHRIDGTKPVSCTYAKRALDFARKNWGNTLIPVTWKSYLKVFLEDSNNRDSKTSRTELALYFVTTRDYNDIINDRSAPITVTLNKNIVRVSNLQTEADEFAGGIAVGYTQYGCANCGAGLQIGGCHACDQHDAWMMPIPVKLTEYAQHLGLQFAVDPSISRAIEQAAWDQCKANEERNAATRERLDLEKQLAAVKKRESAASAAGNEAETRFVESSTARNSAVKAFNDEVTAATQAKDTASKTIRDQKNAKRREQRKAKK